MGQVRAVVKFHPNLGESSTKRIVSLVQVVVALDTTVLVEPVEMPLPGVRIIVVVLVVLRMKT